MPSLTSLIAPRQHRECLLDADGYIDENSCYVPFWYTKTGQIVKWSLFLGLILFIALYITIGFLHAKKRIRENRPPLAYHRVLPPPSPTHLPTQPKPNTSSSSSPAPNSPKPTPATAGPTPPPRPPTTRTSTEVPPTACTTCRRRPSTTRMPRARPCIRGRRRAGPRLTRTRVASCRRVMLLLRLPRRSSRRQG
jgi:type IV secretory pathway VirB10-like protein